MGRTERRGHRKSQIGVIVAQFDRDLGGVLDLDALLKAIRANPMVGVVEGLPVAATKRDIADAASAIGKHGIQRVVVAGCSERLFGRLFRESLAGFGVDPSMVDFADVAPAFTRGQRGSERAIAASFARLVDVAVARVTAGKAMETIEVAVEPTCVVLGGGVAGISAAAAVASRDIKVVLIERDQGLGGLLRRLNAIFPTYMPAMDFVRDQTGRLAEAGIDVITGAEPVGVKGHVGSYEIDLSNGSKVKAGVIIVATGADLLKPEGIFGYGEIDGVITQIELEAMLLEGKEPGVNIVMIQCAGSRNEQRPYCSRVCCTASIKNTILIKQRYPSAKITVLSRGFAEYAGDLDRARDMGVDIIRYSPERPPKVADGVVEVYDEISEMETHISFDRVVLAVPMVASESTRRLAKMLRIPTDRHGFLVEPHLRVRPEEYAPRGIFVAGCAHWPSTVIEAVVQGYGAASRAFELLSSGRVVRRSFVTKVDTRYCRGCGRCEEACEHGAIELEVGEDGMKQANVIPIQCTGCGVCVAVCPSGALSLSDMSSEQTGMTIDAIGRA
jgi:heterodisulfide reductase subunit A